MYMDCGGLTVRALPTQRQPGGWAAAAAIAAVATATSARAADAAPRAAPRAAPGPGAGALIIRARPGVAPADLRRALARSAVAPQQRLAPVFEEGFADPAAAARLGLDRAWRLTPARVPPALAGLVERIEPDPVGGIATIPPDPGFTLQWNMLNTGQVVNGSPGAPGADIHVTPAWDSFTGGAGLVLAVLDAGLDEHVELSGRIIPGRNVAADPDDDDTSNVCNSHGTHVAGIAAATGGNGIGVAGVDWRCRIMPVKVLTSCSGTERQLAEGLVWAADHGADVINMSLQFFGGTELLHDAVLYAHGRGVALVAAAGNTAATQLAFPARWPETIAVGALDHTGARWIASSRGPTLDVMAPGAAVWSLDGTAGYKYLSGTSMAAPHAAGTVALLRAIDPGLSLAQLESILRQTAIDLASPGFDISTGYGRLDTAAAVAAAGPPPPEPTPADLDGDGAVSMGDLLLLLAAWGSCPSGAGCPADLDADGAVAVSDLLILLSAWG